MDMFKSENAKTIATILGALFLATVIWFTFLRGADEKRIGAFGSSNAQQSVVPAASNLAVPLSQVGTAKVEHSGATQAAKAVNARNSLFNEDVRSMMHSNDVTKVDYAILRFGSQCSSLLYGEKGGAYVRATTNAHRTIRGTDVLLVGRATVDERLSGFARSVEACRKMNPGGHYTDEEMDFVRMTTTYGQYRATKDALRNPDAWDSPESRAALSKAIKAPMFGTLEVVMYDYLDLTPLESAYSKEQAYALSTLAVAAVLCRMGDDCGRGGIVTEQLCWQNGICGTDVERAIIANLDDRGLNTTAFQQFVGRVYDSLQRGDGSVFRSKVPRP